MHENEFSRAFFEALNPGLCILEPIGNEAGALADLRCLQANAVFGAQSGLRDAVGRTLGDMLPGELAARRALYTRVLASGEPERFVCAFPGREPLLDACAFCLQDAARKLLAISFQDAGAGRGGQAPQPQPRVARFEALFNTAPLGVFVVDAQLRVCQANPMARSVWPAWPELVGASLPALVQALWPQASADAIVRRYRHTLATGQAVVTAEAGAQRTEHAGPQYYESHLVRIRLGDGTWGVVCYLRDISRHTVAQQQVRDAQKQYRVLLDSMYEGFCVIDMLFDAHGRPVDYRFVQVNPAFEVLTGLREVTGRRIRELAPDHDTHWFEVYGQVALTGESVRFTNEARALDQRWFDVYAFRLGGEGSTKVAVLFSNITERKRAEETLRESNERMRLATQATQVGIWEWNLADNTLWWDAQMFRIYGLEPTPDGRVPYSAWSGAVAPEELAQQEAALRETIRRGEQGGREFRIRRCGEVGWRQIDATDTVRKNAQGQAERVVGTNLDITERSRLQRETEQQARTLASLDRRKDEFLAMLGHELRNPLAALANAAHLLRLQQHDAPEMAQGHGIIERQIGQLKHRVDELLEVSRITSGSMRLHQETVRIDSLVRHAAETAGPLIAQTGHELQVSLPPQAMLLHADAARLEQVLVNLLTNAAKYTPAGGRIWLDVAQEADGPVPMAAISVRDNGIGIAPELLPHIFELFTQAERSLDRAQGGLGIGLSLVQRLVELHGGTVRVRSVLEQGSEFVVRLPLLPAGAGALPAPPAAAPRQAAAARGGCRVLVVDDNVDATQSLGKLLEMTGHQVQLAYDGPSGLEAARQGWPEVVLLDIGLPGLDGFEVAERIRQQPSLQGMVLVALTGYGQDADRQHAQQAGFDHHLVKPTELAEIEKILDAVMTKRAGALAG